MTSQKGTPVSSLGLDPRYENPLRRAGIHTIESLCAMKPKELRRLKSVGVKCLQAIQDALAKRGLCLGAEPTDIVVRCICPNRPAMEFMMGNQRGEILECPSCSRLLYRSKAASVQTWYCQETSLAEGLTIDQRHCMTCQRVEPHLLKVDGKWQCLACLVRENEAG